MREPVSHPVWWPAVVAARAQLRTSLLSASFLFHPIHSGVLFLDVAKHFNSCAGFVRSTVIEFAKVVQSIDDCSLHYTFIT